jgi:replicative DNA helicase
MTSPESIRSYPYAETGEKGALSTAMIDPGRNMPRLCALVTEEDFYLPANRIIFGLMREAYNSGRMVDPTLLQQTLMDRDLMEKVGGPAMVPEIYTFANNSTALEHYCEEIIDKSRRRRGIALAEKMKEAFLDTSEEWLPSVEDVEASLMGMRSTNSHKGLRDGRDVVLDLADSMAAAFKHRGNPMGLSLGFPDIDRVVNGLQPQEFWILAARPGMGKTSFATAIAEAIALDASNKKNCDVLMVTLEMSDVQIMGRSVLGRARIALGKSRTGMFSAAEAMVWKVARRVADANRGATADRIYQALVVDAVGELQDRMDAKAVRRAAEGKPAVELTNGHIQDAQAEIRRLSESIASILTGSLKFYDGYGVTSQELRAQITDFVRRVGWDAEKLKQGHQPPLVIVDYLQLVKACEKKAKGDPRLAIMEVCEMLKGLAKKFQIVIVGLAQVSRGAEENAGRVPMLSHLKEGGSMEEYADGVAFVHRESYYKPWDKLKEDDQEKWEEYAKGRNASKDAELLKEPRWDGESYYSAQGIFAIRKGRACAQADLPVLFRGDLARFAPKTASLYSNNPNQRQQNLPATSDDDAGF